MDTLSSTGPLPVVSALTCVVNRFEVPGYASLGEPDPGPRWRGHRRLGAHRLVAERSRRRTGTEAYSREVFQQSAPTLGDAVQYALQENTGASICRRICCASTACLATQPCS